VTGYNLLKIEFDQWRGLWRDLRGARSFGEVLGYLFKPPGWRADGRGETTEDLRRAAHLPTADLAASQPQLAPQSSPQT
jgi:hypothetical protein